MTRSRVLRAIAGKLRAERTYLVTEVEMLLECPESSPSLMRDIEEKLEEIARISSKLEALSSNFEEDDG